MDSDLDSFDDILLEPAVAHARAAGKFQPRAKPRARKITSTSLPSVLPSNTREKSDSSFPTTLDTTKPVQSVNPLDDRLISPVDSSLVLPSIVLGSEELLENNKNNLKCEPLNSSTQTVGRREDLASPDSLPSEFVVTDSSNNGYSNFLFIEAGSSRLDLDPVDVVVPDTTSSKDVTGNGSKVPVSLSMTTLDVAGEPWKDNDRLSPHEKGSSVTSNLSPARAENAGSVAASLDGNGELNSSLLKSVEDVDSLGFDLDQPDIMFPECHASDSRAGKKFQPKVRSHRRKEISGSSMEQPATVAAVNSHTTQPVESVLTMDKPVDPVCPSSPNLDNESNEPSKENEVLLPHDNNLELVSPSSKEFMPKGDMSSKEAYLAGLDSNFGQKPSGVADSPIEVNSLGLDLDPFADIVLPPAISNARAGGKFQPRGKARPRKVTSESNSFAVSGATVEGPASVVSTVSDNLQSAKFIDVGDGRLMDSVYSTLTTMKSMESKEALRNDDCTNSGVLLFKVDRSSGLENSSHLVASDALHIGDIDRDPHSGLGKSIGENADIFSGLEYIHDFVTQSPRTEIPLPASSDGTEEHSRFPAQISVNSSAPGACNEATENVVTCNEAAVEIDNGKPQSDFQEPGSFPDFESPGILSESAIALECCTRNTQPKSMVQNGKEIPSTSILPDASPPNTQIDPSESVYIDVGSIPTFPSEDVLDYSSISFGNFIPADPTRSEFPVNEERTNLAETSCSSDLNILHHEDVSTVPAKESSKDRKRKSSSASYLAQNESVKSARQLRKRTIASQVVDGPEDEAQDSDGFPSEHRNSSIADGDIDYDYRVDEDNDNEDKVENTSSSRRASKKSKKPMAEQEKKPVSRRKRKNDAPEQPNQQSRKKFSHSTRRKSRLKDLLSIPEDEIDYQKMPFKDIILLAGYKEDLAIKEAKASKNSTKKSTNSLHGEEEDDTVTSEQDGGVADDQSNSLFNCHSFMDKTPTARWSKQDTELFYEGIRQFGTDLSMIQQLFPGRTRHQIKLKYKKEERQHPLRLSEALSNRAKDHSYFEKVMEQLQQVAAQEERESNRGNSVSLTDDEEAQLNPETNEEVAKSDEQDEDVTVDQDGDPLKYDEDDDDFDIWGSYKSEY
ncbi:hypothetical protein MANES_11G084700v8 [Manihot esculenta]|uniref:Uncharacterized protein n=2 Tax=Manihot esculenta TaxID=3983 RepID=A0ACB7GU85_MANES|nr:hypothetical protein MANES_11G084700v8 [Manihot esculenta]OAY37226.1 hypothetical protein MANES_11G084700v8 [Manihot esculenta]